MDILMILVSTYRDSLNTVEPSIYQNLYEDLLSIFQGMFFILNNAGLYVAGCVLSFLAAMFMIFGRDARKVAELKEDLREKVGTEFICPHCKGISTNPYECNSGVEVNGKKCDWKSYGFLQFNLAFLYCKKERKGTKCFMPKVFLS